MFTTERNRAFYVAIAISVLLDAFMNEITLGFSIKCSKNILLFLVCVFCCGHWNVKSSMNVTIFNHYWAELYLLNVLCFLLFLLGAEWCLVADEILAIIHSCDSGLKVYYFSF